MRKTLILFLILFIFVLPVAAERNWEKQYTLDDLYIDSTAEGDLWETVDKADRVNTALVYDKVKIGNPVLTSYSRYGKNAEINDYYKNDYFIKDNQKFYPTGSYLKIIYMGQDSQGNIKLRIYDHYSGNREKIYSRINDLIEKENFMEKDKVEGMLSRTDIESKRDLKEVLIKILTLNSEYYYFRLDTKTDPYNDFELTSSKTIEFGNGLIPPLKITTNRNNSTIKVEVAN